MNELLNAVEAGDLALVQSLIKEGHNTPEHMHKTDDFRNTPLHLASYNGLLDIAITLLDNGADINARALDGKTPLNAAVLYGKSDVAKLLLDRGADINTQGGRGITPLHAAVWYGHQDIVTTLLDRGADINAQDLFGKTPLHAAQSEAAKLLLDRGADINAQDRNGDTPLFHAMNSPEMAKFLIDHGANPNHRNHVGLAADELDICTPEAQDVVRLARRDQLNTIAQASRPATALAAPDEYTARRGRGRCM